MRETDYIEFYRQQKILPWRQDLSDLKAHFERRGSLYRQLGILPGFVKGRTVAELGPGSGHNALYTASLAPSRFVLVEPHLEAVNDMKALFKRHAEWGRPVEIVPAPLDQFTPDERFDFVFCEAVLSGFPDPNRLLRDVGKLVAPGGLLVITCIDDMSIFAESLRRLLGFVAVDPCSSVDERIAKLLPIFSPHLAQLPGMTRGAEAWILDNLINPTWDKHAMFEAIEAVANEFTVLSSSPRFLVEWRWYKQLHGAARDFNGEALRQYWSNVHSFLDHTKIFPPRDPTANKTLYARCERVRSLIRRFEGSRDRSLVSEISSHLNAVVHDVASFSPELAEAFGEVEQLLRGESLDVQVLANSRQFGRLFGRGMQYLSLERCVE